MKLFFLHLMKCGGTTLTSLLDQMFDMEEIAPYNIYENIDSSIDQKLLIEEARSYKFIRGHYRFDRFNEICDDHISLTMLRHPIRRNISLYKHWKEAAHHFYAEDCSRIIEFKKFIRSHGINDVFNCETPWVRAIFDNGQTRQLSGLGFYGNSNSELLRAAIKNLESIDIVTIVERFSESLKLIQKYTNMVLPIKFQNLNESKINNGSESENEETLKLIKSKSELDIELYQRAIEIFDKKLGEYGSENHNHLISNFSSELSLPMSSALRGTGWHTREGTPETEILRWTGPSCESTFHCSLKPNDYQFRLGLQGSMKSSYLHESKLVVGTKQFSLIPETEYINDIEQIALTATVPTNLINSIGETIFRVVTPETISHYELDPTVNDKRKKGLLIRYIKLAPKYVRAAA